MKALVCVILIFAIMGCAASAKMTKSSDSGPAPKKFDLGEFYFKWAIMFPLEILVGIPSGTLFMTKDEVERKFLKPGPSGKKEEEKEKKEKGQKWLKY